MEMNCLHYCQMTWTRERESVCVDRVVPSYQESVWKRSCFTCSDSSQSWGTEPTLFKARKVVDNYVRLKSKQSTKVNNNVIWGCSFSNRWVKRLSWKRFKRVHHLTNNVLLMLHRCFYQIQCFVTPFLLRRSHLSSPSRSNNFFVHSARD